MLPAALPEPAGWTTAVRYLPAGRTDAGGDFYDLVPLDGGRLAMFVGDVMGRGVKAASVMAQMRSAMRTLIAVDPRPDAADGALDRVFETLHVDQLVTTVYALADPAAGPARVVSAGHPEPLRGPRRRVDRGAEPARARCCSGSAAVTARSSRWSSGPATRCCSTPTGWSSGVARTATRAPRGSSAALTSLRADDLEDWLTRVVETTRDPTRDDDVAAMLVVRNA